MLSLATWLALAAGSLQAQQTLRTRHVEVFGGGGFPVAHYDFMYRYITAHTLQAQLAFSLNAAVPPRWQHLWNFSDWGLQCGSLLLNNSTLGNTHYLQLYHELPLDPSRHLRLRLSAGGGWASKPFNLADNPENSALGTGLNAALQVRLLYVARLGKVDLVPSVMVTHFSNGAYQLPNLGINVVTAGAGLRLGGQLKDLPAREPDTLNPFFSPFVALVAGNRQQVADQTEAGWLVYAQAGMLRRYSERAAWLGYAELCYYKYRTPNELGTGTYQTGFRPALAAGWQLYFNQIRFALHAGAYLSNPTPSTGSIFNRYQLQYGLMKNRLWLGTGLKSHFAKAEHIELNLCYQWR